jgi:hypothetical protein
MLAIGAAIAPASWARRTSRRGQLWRGGSPRRRRSPRSPRTAPVILTTLYGRWRRGPPWRHRLVAAIEGDRRGTLEEEAKGSAPASSGGDLHQPVLDDVVADVLLAQGSPDLAELGNLEAAVFGDDHRRAAPSFLGQLRDGLALGLGRHCQPPWAAARSRRAAVGRPSRRLRRVSGGTDGKKPLRRLLRHRGAPTHADGGWSLPRRARRRPRRPAIRSVGFSPDRPADRSAGARRRGRMAVCGGPSYSVCQRRAPAGVAGRRVHVAVAAPHMLAVGGDRRRARLYEAAATASTAGMSTGCRGPSSGRS